MLHETAVSWLTNRLNLTTPQTDWEKTEENFATRLRDACQLVNDSYDVEGLCQQLNQRVTQLIDLEGDRLSN